MLGFLLKKPHLTAGATVAVLFAITNGTSASSSPPSDKTSASLSIPQRLLGITSFFPVSAGGWEVPFKHHFFAPQKDSKCCQGCLRKNSIANAASAVAPAVVNISSIDVEGSGTIITPDGWILTCAHLLPYDDQVTVKLQDGRIFDSDVYFADYQSDVAIVKIDSNTPLPSARFGKSAQLRPGDWVVAVGCPLYLKNTITAGIISCIDRKGTDIVGFDGAGTEFIQTDCATNKGSSGGPLVNLDGEIVGMNALKVMEADGLSFAVPIDVVTKIIERFKKIGIVETWLGVLIDPNPVIIPRLKEKDQEFPNVTSGVLITAVAPGSTGELVGFHANDVIISLDGKPVKSVNEIVNILGDSVGVPLRVDVVRQWNKHVNLSVVLEEAKCS